jgi:hypothetical protein
MSIDVPAPRIGALVFWVALLIVAALSLGTGTLVLARYGAERAATAELYFNPDAAYVDNFALTHIDRPAVAAAKSMLSDAVVLAVVRRAGDTAGDPAAAIAAFRSALTIEEP